MTELPFRLIRGFGQLTDAVVGKTEGAFKIFFDFFLLIFNFFDKVSEVSFDLLG